MEQPQRTSLPALNFLELEQLISDDLARNILGAKIDRIFIPQAVLHPDGYFKLEWCIDFYHPTHAVQLFFSLRSQACSLFFLKAHSFKAAKNVSPSPLDLTISKHLVGQKISSLKTIEGDRIVELKLGTKTLLISLIPSRPEAILLDQGIVVFHSNPKNKDHFIYPVSRALSSEVLKKFTLRPELLESYTKNYLVAREQESLRIKTERLDREIQKKMAFWVKKKESFSQQLAHHPLEPDWLHYGKLLQSQLYTQPKLENGFYSLFDYEQEKKILIPGDEKLALKQQLEYYFHQAKRVKTRFEEATTRMAQADEKIKLLHQTLNALSRQEFLEVEAVLGVTQKKNKLLDTFSGKRFVSQEGLTILVGTDQTENLELTFKVAKGNDIWMHVKGRPGAHVVVLIPQKKSASLETLLDAASLCILYSGGKEWGKTEVDYTFRKFVKKIKKQTDVSYSSNKTLVASADQMRLKRLVLPDARSPNS